MAKCKHFFIPFFFLILNGAQVDGGAVFSKGRTEEYCSERFEDLSREGGDDVLAGRWCQSDYTYIHAVCPGSSDPP